MQTFWKTLKETKSKKRKIYGSVRAPHGREREKKSQKYNGLGWNYTWDAALVCVCELRESISVSLNPSPRYKFTRTFSCLYGVSQQQSHALVFSVKRSTLFSTFSTFSSQGAWWKKQTTSSLVFPHGGGGVPVLLRKSSCRAEVGSRWCWAHRTVGSADWLGGHMMAQPLLPPREPPCSNTDRATPSLLVHGIP